MKFANISRSVIMVFLILLTSSCSVTYVNATKTVHIHSDGNVTVDITGSDLKGNSASQKADGKLSIPLVP